MACTLHYKNRVLFDEIAERNFFSSFSKHFPVLLMVSFNRPYCWPREEHISQILSNFNLLQLALL